MDSEIKKLKKIFIYSKYYLLSFLFLMKRSQGFLNLYQLRKKQLWVDTNAYYLEHKHQFSEIETKKLTPKNGTEFPNLKIDTNAYYLEHSTYFVEIKETKQLTPK